MKWTHEILLPQGSDISVETGDFLYPGMAIATGEAFGRMEIIDVAGACNVPPSRVEEVLLVSVGEHLEEGSVLAQRRMLPFDRYSCKVPYKGTVEYISSLSGYVVYSQERKKTVFYSMYQGEVVSVESRNRIVLSLEAEKVACRAGVGQLCYGRVVVADHLNAHTYKEPVIAVVQGQLHKSDLYYFMKRGVSGVVASCADASDLEDVFGGMLMHRYQDCQISVLLTEGYGKREVDRDLYTHLRKHAGQYMTLDPQPFSAEIFTRPSFFLYSGNGAIK